MTGALSGSGRIVAIVPARGGSKGIPGKNLRPVGGIPLIARTVAAALAATEIDLVVVSSDDDEILRVAETAGAMPLRRPADLSGDEASSEAAIAHALHTLDAQGQAFDIVVFLQCTSPFTTGADVSAMARAFDDPGIASALTVSPNHGFLWRRSADGRAQGVNHDEAQPRRRRQDLEPEFRENGAIYGMRVAPFRAQGRRFIEPIALVETAMPVVEIDDPSDLAIVEAIIAQREEPASLPRRALPEDLRAIKILVTDFDGVHTDDTVYVDETGRETVRCSRRDGLGVSMLRERTDIRFLILSKEANPVVTRRAEKLRADVIQGVGAKRDVLFTWLEERGLGFGDVAYVGNDLNDLECLKAARIGFVPSDAHSGVTGADMVPLDHPGGGGAVRQVCDLLLGLRR